MSDTESSVVALRQMVDVGEGRDGCACTLVRIVECGCYQDYGTPVFSHNGIWSSHWSLVHLECLCHMLLFIFLFGKISTDLADRPRDRTLDNTSIVPLGNV